MQTILLTTLQAVGVILAADFVAGFVHWLEDAYIREDTPLIGKHVARNNIIHHHLPRHFTKKNWWQSSWDLVGLGGLIVLLAWFAGVLTWYVWLFVVIVANSNQVHKWAHQT